MIEFEDVITYDGFFKDEYQITNEGKVYSNREKRFISSHIIPGGYEQVCLSKNGVKKYPMVHQLVVDAFIRPYNRATEQTNHKNHIRSDNRLQNLQILSIKEHHDDPITKQNISKALKGTRTGKDNSHFGIPMTKELKEKLRTINTGRKLSEQTIAKRQQTKRLKRLNDPKYGKRV